MQDIQSIGGRFFTGAGGGAFDRRLRPLHNNYQQTLKCPRCDSINTKFCYYNNYNLSQPRHFCKSCCRYWTKGGVLRNVPVGGGCRKTKRSKLTSSSPPKQNTSSSSDSSSLTNTAAAAVSVPSTSSASNPRQDSKLVHVSGVNTGFETTGMLSDMGEFSDLITGTNDASFGFTSINDISASSQSQWEVKLSEMSGVYEGNSNGGFGSLDWQQGCDQGLFDVTNTVDQAYWSQGQWNYQPSLYIP